MSTLENLYITDVHETVALACRLYGQKRGWAVAAELLGITERTARGITYGETNGASVDPDIAFNARMKLRRARAEQIRAELRELEITHVETRDGVRAPVGAHR
jgi:hypothetical protein